MNQRWLPPGSFQGPTGFTFGDRPRGGMTPPAHRSGTPRLTRSPVVQGNVGDLDVVDRTMEVQGGTSYAPGNAPAPAGETSWYARSYGPTWYPGAAQRPSSLGSALSPKNMMGPVGAPAFQRPDNRGVFLSGGGAIVDPETGLTAHELAVHGAPAPASPGVEEAPPLTALHLVAPLVGAGMAYRSYRAHKSGLRAAGAFLGWGLLAGLGVEMARKMRGGG